MNSYETLTPVGDYDTRVALANARAKERGGQAAHIQIHADTNPDPNVDRSLGIWMVGTPPESQALARQAAECAALRVPRDIRPFRRARVELRGPGQPVTRGYICLEGSEIPACLLEIGMVSSPAFATWVITPAGISAMADAVVFTVTTALGPAGLAVISVGHVGRPKKPGDKGANVWGSHLMEADVCGMIAAEAVKRLRGI